MMCFSYSYLKALSDCSIRCKENNRAGNAGQINIDVAENITLLKGVTLSTVAKSAGSGQLSIETSGLIYLENSNITTSVYGGAGNGGDINIQSNTIVQK